MKSIYTLFFALISICQLSAQCDDLMFSEYVEGYANNKALEFYNPTDSPLELSDYSLIRFSNGSTDVASDRIIQLPAHSLQPYDVFVIVVDLVDTSLWDSQFDKPAWNGYNVIDTIFDNVTGEPRLDSLGNVILGPQYSMDGAAIFGNEYNEQYDLQIKADAFLCPDYNTNNAMYFNGNDAMAIIKGTMASPTGDNIIDVIGVIGEDPEETIMQDAWIDENGSWLTKNSTLVRKANVTVGNNDPSKIIFPQGTFAVDEWIDYPNNSFQYLGFHDSVCETVSTDDIVVGQISLYPNPVTKGAVNIEAEQGIKNVMIYDLDGRLMRTEFNEGRQNMTIKVSGLSSGMYIVRTLLNDDKVELVNIVVE